ncbi:NAD-dependent epimerase/dehydratase family protein [archaeon]|jgi:nucleoside-diphosphate-sugar epimerase/cephalosporin hydroxylase|nr:NAD-dependent epimerase/dehydratase family protein [archaeon]MBT3451364.1 NAD-dependent epimerase/dehydratase family protein [archaeon]MBT6869320.1 NAD-dependent epimerase/dehydratase family protein [archaeon]MBT7192483.1 NAD-dependent epimerase/dehydratase family protein [archaeon]MBT7380559.1 NAD-dependent epimerase/dehydratase family protein [archaeon]
MKIFITGGTGFVGKPVIERLNESGDEILILSRKKNLFNNDKIKVINGDLSSIDNWKDTLKEFNPELTIHMAWEGIPDYSSEMSIKNLNNGLNLYKVLADIGCKKIITTGSCWEYGEKQGIMLEDRPPKLNNSFISAKNSLYNLGKEIAKENQQEFVWARLFYVYGPGQNEHSLLPQIVHKISKGEDIQIKTPYAKNDFIYVNDVAEAIYSLTRNCISGIYNVGSGKSTEIKEIVNIVYNHFKFNMIYSPEKQDNKFLQETNFWADITKINNLTGWTPKISINEGVKKMCENITSNGNVNINNNNKCNKNNDINTIKNNKTVLVTGNLGYIGSVLVPMLIEKGFNVVGYDINYYDDSCLLYDTNQKASKQIIKDIRDVSKEDLNGVDAIIHLAGLSNDPLGEFDPQLTKEINFEGTIKLALMAKEVGVKRFVYASSQSMYGKSDTDTEIKEDMVDTTSMITEYAKTKWDAECVLHKLHSDEFTVVCFRPSTVFGVSPKLRLDIVFNNFVACAFSTGNIEIKSDGTPWRPAIHVRDVSNAFIAGIIAPKELIANQSYNVGMSEGNYTVRNLAEAAQECVPGSTVVFTGEHGPDSRTYKVSFEKILTELKDYYQPEWGLIKGGKELVETLKKVNFTEQDFRGKNFIRLNQLNYLIKEKKINSNLRTLKKVEGEKMNDLRQYVLTEKNKDVEQLKKNGDERINLIAKNKLNYEIDWFGIPIIQTPEDIVMMQELIYNLKPDVIIDIGVAHGGSAIYYSSLLELLGKGKVIGVDIDIRKHNLEVLEKHPFFKRIELIEGSSIDDNIVQKVKDKIPENSTVLLCLDSNHTKEHVLQELRMYWDLVGVNSYIVVFDTVTSELAKNNAAEERYLNNGPSEAIDIFLKENGHFEIDKKFNKLYVSHCMDGYLKRVK